jgi:ferredoxin-NADP reductase
VGRRRLQAFEGAERAWRFRWIPAGACAKRCRCAGPSATGRPTPPSPAPGTRPRRRREAQRLAQTWRPYRVTDVVDESSVIRSFHLAPADGRAVPPFQAGQHLPIRLKIAGGETLHRTYTISQAPSDQGLRLSIKREGVASIHLHDRVHDGDVIEALGPRGQFTIDAALRRPAVLIGAGVGITPMVAFARHVVTEGFLKRRTRPLHLIQVARREDLRAFGAELRALEQRAKGAMKLHVVLDEGEGAPEAALKGPLTLDLLKTLLPFDDHEFFLCGPPGFMQALYDGLRDLGVRDARIQAEAFGPSSLKRRPDDAAAAPPCTGPCGHPGHGELHAQRRRRRVDARAWHSAGVCRRQGPEPAVLLPCRALRLLRHAYVCRPSHLCRAHGVATGRRRGAAVLRSARSRRWRTHRARPVRPHPTIAR